jgi:hypothetical protein
MAAADQMTNKVKYSATKALLANLPPPSELQRAVPIDWEALDGKEPPPRRWAVRNWVGFDQITLMPGDAGIGKTLLAQQIGACLALKRDFIDEIPAALPVLFWGCEDDGDEFHRRQVRIAQYLDVPLRGFKNLHIVPRVGLDNTLVSSEFGHAMPTPLMHILQEQAFDLQADVVILDNVAQLFGINENDRHEVTASMNALLGALPGRAILLLAHPSRMVGSEFSGSGAWEAVARTRLYLGSKLPGEKPAGLDDEPEDDVRYLAKRKANYSARDWRRFTYRAGVLVPDPATEPAGMLSVIRKDAAERAVIEGLRRLGAMGLDATDAQGTQRYLPAMLVSYKLAEGCTKSELADAMRRLMTEGRLRRAAVGKYSNRAERMGLVEVAR